MKNTELEIITSVKKILGNPGLNVVIVPHENPDGDAIGSAIGLSEVLWNFGHQVEIVSPNDYPEFLKWFASEIKIIDFNRSAHKGKEAFRKADVLICVDFNEAGRAAKLEKEITGFDKTTMVIDHHPNPKYFTDFTISEPKYSSTAELIFDLVHQIGMGKNITRNSAEALYTGILTDTGSFSHNTSRPNTFKVVSELMKFGIDTDKIQSFVYDNFSADRMKLLGYCLNEKMTVYPQYRSAVITISKEELERFNFEPGDTEGFVNYPLSIKNIVFSAIFIEKNDFVKASFRSKGDFPTNKIAREYYNGGGHLNASGGESRFTLEETFNNFAKQLKEFEHRLLKTVI